MPANKEGRSPADLSNTCMLTASLLIFGVMCAHGSPAVIPPDVHLCTSVVLHINLIDRCRAPTKQALFS